MKKLIDFLSLLAIFFTSLTIILTLITTYQFAYIDQIFNSYLPIQIGILITMSLFAVKFFFFEKGRRKTLYTICCLIIAACSVFFIAMNVK